jgi:uncharacterized protein YqjF (DUF2071 family)
MSTIFLTAEWRRLVMLNFPIEPKALQEHTPKGTELDDWEDTVYVSLVAFLFLDTKVKGMTIPFHRNFEEINLRFYVRSRGPKGWRRGVVFVREVVPKQAIAFLARTLYNENYIACPTRSSVIDPSGDTVGKVEYGWRPDEQWLSIGAEFLGQPSLPEKNSLEEFITEHYWGYSTQRDGGTMEYQVEHPQWKVWETSEATMSGDIIEFYGPEFASALQSPPSSAFVAEGSPVTIHNGNRMEDRANA